MEIAVATIVVTPPDLSKGETEYSATTEVVPEETFTSKTFHGAIGRLVRFCNTELEIDDRDLQIQFGVPWDDSDDDTIGHIVARNELADIRRVTRCGGL